MNISLENIIDIYEKSKPWYGNANNVQNDARVVNGIKDCLEDIELVLLDSFGVLCRGHEVIAEAIKAIAYLREKNIPICVVSNDTMTSRRTSKEKYEKLGFDFSTKEILTSLDVTEDYLEKQNNLSTYAATGLTNHVLADKFAEIQNLNESNGCVRGNVETLLYLVGAGWSDEMQRNLVKTSKNIKNVIVGNPDVGAPVDKDFVKTPGYYLIDFYEKTKPTSKPTLLGKPSAVCFKQALEQTGYKGKPENVLMVGDTLHTDILGGNAMGFKTLLVESGLFMQGNRDEYIEKTSIVPTFIAPTL